MGTVTVFSSITVTVVGRDVSVTVAVEIEVVSSSLIDGVLARGYEGSTLALCSTGGKELGNNRGRLKNSRSKASSAVMAILNLIRFSRENFFDV